MKKQTRQAPFNFIDALNDSGIEAEYCPDGTIWTAHATAQPDGDMIIVESEGIRALVAAPSFIQYMINANTRDTIYTRAKPAVAKPHNWNTVRTLVSVIVAVFAQLVAFVVAR